MSTNSKEYNKANYKKYWWSTKAKKDRRARNNARRKALKKGTVKKWDKKEVHHKRWIAWWNWAWNLWVVSRKYNRQDWARKANKSKWSWYKLSKTIKSNKKNVKKRTTKKK